MALIKVRDLKIGHTVFVGGGWFKARIVEIERGTALDLPSPPMQLITSMRGPDLGRPAILASFEYEPDAYHPGQFEQALRPDAMIYVVA